MGDVQAEVSAHWLEGLVLLDQGNIAAGRVMLEKALAASREIGAHWIARDIEAALL